MTQKLFLQSNQNYLQQSEMKTSKFKHVFLTTCTGKIQIYHVKKQALAGKLLKQI